jgi:serine/threonine-protein kinase
MAQFAPESVPDKRAHIPPTPPARGDSDPISLPTGPYESTPLGAELDSRVTTPQDGRSTPADGRPASGRFGAYELLEVIRRGGMGVVYRARDTRLDRIVALKTIRADLLGQDPRMVERFRREAMAIAQLDHQHIVPIHDFGEQDGRHYFAMAFAPCGSLFQHLPRFSADPQDTAKLVKQKIAKAVALMKKVAIAVHHAHERGIFHRDLKPANVLLDEHDEPMVTDFGLAKCVDDEAELTQPGAVMGTPSYMAPEQAGGQSKDAGPATDVWALGVMLYELLTGRRPFTGIDSEEVRRQVREADPPRPRTVQRALDRSLETIVLKCLDEHPARRYPSARALADDLERWSVGKPILARPEGWARRLWRVVRRHPALAAALPFLAAVALITAAVLAYRDPDRPVKKKREDLARGNMVTLIPETGPPEWSRWVLGVGGAMDPPSAQAPFQVNAYDLGLLELLPAPLPDRYLFRAEVHAGPDNPKAQVGIYFGHNKQATAQGTEHCFCQLVLTPPIPLDEQLRTLLLRVSSVGLLGSAQGTGPLLAASQPTPGPLYVIGLDLYLRRYRERGSEPADDRQGSTGVGRRRVFQPSNGVDGWHLLAATVTPETVQVSWDGLSIGVWRRDDPLLNARRILKGNPEVDPAVEFGPRGGLGICVYRGGAEYRRVVVEPIP